MAKILIIEDEEITAMALESLLESQGHIISASVNNAVDALLEVEKEIPDLIISDIMIKGAISGCELSSQLYNKYQMPIIFLTAYCNDEIIQYAKDANASAYLIKPYKEEELKVSIELALSRKKFGDNRNSDELKFSSYTLCLKMNELYLGKEKIQIGKKGLKLLELLSKKPNQILSYETLIFNIYGEFEPSSIDNLRQLVKRTKEKLNLEELKSVKGQGYILRE